MSHQILLYGATGYSGRLIAAEADLAGMRHDSSSGCRMVVAGRDGRKVSELAAKHRMDHRTFRLEDRDGAVRSLSGIDVVINAAGPFALTANHLVRAALAAGCHYVDINGEPDVYMTLDDLGRNAIHRARAIVSSAGYSAAASDLLLRVALHQLRQQGAAVQPIDLGAVRIAFFSVTNLSRGSLETLWRSLREQVRVIRFGETSDIDGNSRKAHVIWHEPVGRLERTFDFHDIYDTHLRRPRRRAAANGSGIASAANLVDTLTARITVERANFVAHRIESYQQVGTGSRLAYQLGPLFTPLSAIPFGRALARLQLSMLPSGPDIEERRTHPGLVVLEIEDPFQTRVVHWAFHTPNPYDFTAQVVVEVARRLTGTSLRGWLTPSEVLQPTIDALRRPTGYLRGCGLTERKV